MIHGLRAAAADAAAGARAIGQGVLVQSELGGGIDITGDIRITARGGAYAIAPLTESIAGVGDGGDRIGVTAVSHDLVGIAGETPTGPGAVTDAVLIQGEAGRDAAIAIARDDVVNGVGRVGVAGQGAVTTGHRVQLIAGVRHQGEHRLLVHQHRSRAGRAAATGADAKRNGVLRGARRRRAVHRVLHPVGDTVDPRSQILAIVDGAARCRQIKLVDRDDLAGAQFPGKGIIQLAITLLQQRLALVQVVAPVHQCRYDTAQGRELTPHLPLGDTALTPGGKRTTIGLAVVLTALGGYLIRGRLIDFQGETPLRVRLCAAQRIATRAEHLHGGSVQRTIGRDTTHGNGLVLIGRIRTIAVTAGAQQHSDQYDYTAEK